MGGNSKRGTCCGRESRRSSQAGEIGAPPWPPRLCARRAGGGWPVGGADAVECRGRQRKWREDVTKNGREPRPRLRLRPTTDGVVTRRGVCRACNRCSGAAAAILRTQQAAAGAQREVNSDTSLTPLGSSEAQKPSCFSSSGLRYSATLSVSIAISMVAMPGGVPAVPSTMCLQQRSLRVM